MPTLPGQPFRVSGWGLLKLKSVPSVGLVCLRTCVNVVCVSRTQCRALTWSQTHGNWWRLSCQNQWRALSRVEWSCLSACLMTTRQHRHSISRCSVSITVVSREWHGHYSSSPTHLTHSRYFPILTPSLPYLVSFASSSHDTHTAHTVRLMCTCCMLHVQVWKNVGF